MKEKLKKEATGFTQIKNSVITDKRLSLKAKGLYVLIYSKPEDWDFSVKRLSDESKEMFSSTNEGIKELERAGYLTRVKRQDGKKDWFISLFPTCENPNLRKPQLGKTTTISNKKKKVIKKRNKGNFFQKSQRDFSLEPIEDKIESKKEFMKRKGLPYTPRKRTTKQKDTFSKMAEVQKVIDYFKNKGREIHGMNFLEGDTSRNKRVLKQVKDIMPRLEDYKAFIDWWFYEDNDWCAYEPEMAFSHKIIERFGNKNKRPRVLKL